MQSRYFLFADEIFRLDEATDPLANPRFPLTREAYDRITVEELVALLTETFANEPELPLTRPGFVIAVGHMLNEKGGVNAVRPSGESWPGAVKWAFVPEASLAMLSRLREMGALTPQVVEEAVWSRVA
ncbi:MAG: hypothetical protein H6923_01030 [Alphaproteobacteria bacterium]|nr:hypothetical protein [Alphaproteobacteria bacterium]